MRKTRMGRMIVETPPGCQMPADRPPGRAGTALATIHFRLPAGLPGERVELQRIHCFLVHAAKREPTQPAISGTVVPHRGQVFEMLKNIFDTAETQTCTDISFDHDTQGTARNPCRDLLLAYARTHHVDDGRQIALRLQGVTSTGSGMGLLFLMLGGEGASTRLVLSRFPAHQGILAQESKESLAVEFLDKVFMRSTTAYKAAVFAGRGDLGTVWAGKAIDKQVNHPGEQVARYWIKDFLASSLRTTPAAGTKRLAVALRSAVQGLRDAQVKSEITAAVTLSAGVTGKTLNAQEFCERYGLSESATAAVKAAMRDERLMQERFQFDADEFRRHVAFRSIELSNGGILTAEASRFDEIFKQEHPALPEHRDDEVVITTQGRVVNERLRKAKT